MKCCNHKDTDAQYQCVSCELLLCKECVKSFKVGGLITNFCSGCNSRCKEVETLSEEELESDSSTGESLESSQEDVLTEKKNDIVLESDLSVDIQNNDVAESDISSDLSVNSQEDEKLASHAADNSEDDLSKTIEDKSKSSSDIDSISQPDPLVSDIEPFKDTQKPSVVDSAKVKSKENEDELSSSDVVSNSSGMNNVTQTYKVDDLNKISENNAKIINIKKTTSTMLKTADVVPVARDKTAKLFKPVKTIVGVDGSITNNVNKKDNSVAEVVERLQKAIKNNNLSTPQVKENKILESQKESVESVEDVSLEKTIESEQVDELEQNVKYEHKGKLAIPNSISIFFKIIFDPARAFKDSILDLNTSKKFRISFFIMTSLFIFFSVYLKSLHGSVLVTSLEIAFLNVIFTLIFTGFLSRLGKVSYLFDFASFVFGISAFIYLLQIISISYFDLRFQGAIISGISVVFLFFRIFIFVLGVNKAFDVNLVRACLFFMIAFSFSNLLIFIVSRILFQI